MINQVVENIPIVGQTYGLVKTAMRVYNATSPIEAVKVAIVGVAVDCSPPVIKYPVKCTALAVQIFATILSGGNPWAVALSIGSMRQLLPTS